MLVLLVVWKAKSNSSRIFLVVLAVHGICKTAPNSAAIELPWYAGILATPSNLRSVVANQKSRNIMTTNIKKLSVILSNFNARFQKYSTLFANVKIIYYASYASYEEMKENFISLLREETFIKSFFTLCVKSWRNWEKPSKRYFRLFPPVDFRSPDVRAHSFTFNFCPGESFLFSHF